MDVLSDLIGHTLAAHYNRVRGITRDRSSICVKGWELNGAETDRVSVQQLFTAELAEAAGQER
jgi:hypothetical protein